MRPATLLICTSLLLGAGCSGEAEGGAAESGTAAEASADATPAGPDLAGALAFADPASCEWGEAAEALFEGAIVFGEDYVTRPGTVAVPGIDAPATARISRPEPEAPDYIEVDLDFEGQWLGLPVTGLTDAFIEESDGVFGRGIRFAAPVDAVVAALRGAGFEVNEDGSERERTLAEGESAVTSVEREGEETVFHCNIVYNY